MDDDYFCVVKIINKISIKCIMYGYLQSGYYQNKKQIKSKFSFS